VDVGAGQTEGKLVGDGLADQLRTGFEQHLDRCRVFASDRRLRKAIGVSRPGTGSSNVVEILHREGEPT